MASSSSSSSSKRRRSYDVFLSFRGTDVRNYFLGHLYTALDQSGINTYMDSEDLKKGEQISPALMEAIEESQIAIIVFSKDFASSPWCLEEVVKIMECKEQRGLMVFPVFYKVEPREVRGQREGYAEAMAKHEVKFGEDSEKVKRWKKALLNAGSLSGWHFMDGYEAGLIQDIIQEISTQLDRTPLDVATYPVGMDSRVLELKTILNLQSKEDVLMVGLWGQGGVGKTTLAKAIYNAIFKEFQVSSFSERVRENSKNSNDLVPLQVKLLSELTPRKKITVFNVGGGSRLIQERLCNKKVLIILDDVDDEHQLNALARDHEWFAKGSRIIITTRDKHLLTDHGVDHIYEVKTLEDGEALELFRRHAFRRNQKIEIRSNLVDSVLHYAKGLPLALEVLGSFLCGRGEDEWKSTLQKLTKSTNKKINDVLKVSYDGLEDNEKEIFLDIACFFKGQTTEYIKKVLDSCDFDTTIGVQILIERSLISGEKGCLQMHDLIQVMGINIVKEESRDDPGQRSRLWLHDDVFNVLSGDVGTSSIKAIVLELLKPEETYICPNAFTNMRNLRLLILRNVDTSCQCPIHLPNELRWLEWTNCSTIPEFGHGPNKLVGPDMQNGKINQVPGQFKDCIKLKSINFSGCQSLVCMPNLNCTPNLEILNLHGCENLERAHESVSYHNKLQFLNLGGCSKLHHLPDVLQFENLQNLILADCSKLQRLPDFSDKMKGLRGLSLQRASIEGLPTSIENLVSLREFHLDGCKKLTILPSSIYRLPKLEFLSLHGCSKLVKFPKMEGHSSGLHTKMGFPQLWSLNLDKCNLSEIEFLENPSCFPSLNYLSLAGNNFTNLPTCEQQYKLSHLPVSYCLPVSYYKRVQEILKIPGQFQRGWAIGCESLSERPSNISDFYKVDVPSRYERARKILYYHEMKKEDFHQYHGCRELFVPGGEMPEWLLPNNEGHISLLASKDLIEKFLGLAFCVVVRAKCGEENDRLEIELGINNIHRRYTRTPFLSDFDHVFLRCYEPRLLWHDCLHSPNDWNRFTLSIRALGNPIVKMCGFRLICKPLENDLEIFLQHNQSLDPALLYEVRHEDNQTSMVKESSSETEDLLDNKTSREENSSSDLILEGSNVTANVTDIPIQNYRYSRIRGDLHNSVYQSVVPRGEMPKEFVPVEDGTISFMASQDLYDKFLGLILCVVFSVEDGKKKISFDIVPHVNDERRNVLSGTIRSFDSDNMWIQYLKPNVLWGLLEGGVDFDQFKESYLQFSLRIGVSGGTVKKLGYMLRCRQLKDDLKVVLEDNQFVDSAALCQDFDESIDSGEFLRKFHFPTELVYSESESEIESESESEIESESESGCEED